jgi:hypothetical protein
MLSFKTFMPSSKRAAASAVLLIALGFFYAHYLHGFVKTFYGGNITGLMCIGRLGSSPGIVGDDLYIRKDEGYDSMLFLFIALDPWLKKQVTIDSTAPYRYQRFLYPLLASTVSMGARKLIPYALVAISLLSIVLGTWLTMKLCDHFGTNRIFSLFYGLTVTTYLCLMRTTAEPLYLLMLMAAFYFYIVKDDLFKTAVFLSLAVLTKEIALATVVGIALYDVLERKRFKNLKYFLAPAAVYGLFQIYVYARYVIPVLSKVPAIFLALGMYPMQGLVDEARDIWPAQWTHLTAHGNQLTPEAIQIAVLLNILFAALLIIVNWAQSRRFSHPFHILGLFYLVLAHIGASEAPYMIDIWGYGRHTAEIFVALMFLFWYQKQKVFLIPLLINSAACWALISIQYYQ